MAELHQIVGAISILDALIERVNQPEPEAESPDDDAEVVAKAQSKTKSFGKPVRSVAPAV